MTSDARREIDTVLDALLRREPPPLVVAIDEAGLFVSMPATVPTREGCLIEGRTSALQLVISEDMPVVVELFHRTLREGSASSPVRLLGHTGTQVELWFVDAPKSSSADALVSSSIPKTWRAPPPTGWKCYQRRPQVIVQDCGTSIATARGYGLKSPTTIV